jgi:signal transduction histidine kinase
LLAGLGVLLLVVCAGGYVVVRAVTRELAVARLQSDFVSAVSHEFRTPLTSLRHLTELLESGKVDTEDRRRQYYAVLARETERLHRMVEGLLEFGRLEAGRRQYEFEEVNPVQFVTDVVTDFRAEIESTGRHVEMNVADLGPQAPHVRVDREAIGRAIRNLLENAVRYSIAPAPVSVEVTREGKRVVIRVRDEGVGIPREEQAMIFDQFVRGSAARALNAKGTGVGLSMVRHIIRAHGGEISVRSEPGRGSTFSVVLPAVGFREAGGDA